MKMKSKMERIVKNLKLRNQMRRMKKKNRKGQLKSWKNKNSLKNNKDQKKNKSQKNIQHIKKKIGEKDSLIPITGNNIILRKQYFLYKKKILK